MPRVLLINPGAESANKHTTHRRVHRDAPPLGILYVGSFLKSKGYDVKLLDTHVDEVAMPYELDYDWVGISVIIGPAMKEAGHLIDLFKAEEVPVVLGGVMPTLYMSEMHDEYQPDVVVAGQYARVIQPDWSLLGEKINKQQVPYFHMIMSSTGCQFNCAHCYNKGLGKSLQLRTFNSITQEIEQLIDICGTEVITFGDDSFFASKSRALELFEWCKSKGIYIEEVVGHINQVDEELIAAMHGLVTTFIFSVETASPYLQNILKKEVNFEHMYAMMHAFEATGIACNVSFMAGLPLETDRHLDENIKMMERIKQVHPLSRGNCYLWLPLPRTELTMFAEDLYRVDLHLPLREYEKANFWVREPQDKVGYRFRPFLDKARFAELVKWVADFNERFKYEGIAPYKLDEVLA